MEIVIALCRDSKWPHWKDGLLWFGWTLVCGLMPIWWALLSQLVGPNSVNIFSLTERGEFALYAASYIGGSFFIVVRELRKNTFPSQALLSLLLVSLLALAVFVFTHASNPSPVEQVNATSAGFRWGIFFSCTLLPITIILNLLIMVAENSLQSTDVRTAQKREQENLGQQFDKLKDTSRDR